MEWTGRWGRALVLGVLGLGAVGLIGGVAVDTVPVLFEATPMPDDYDTVPEYTAALEDARAREENARDTTATLAGGTVGLLIAYLTYARVRAQEHQLEAQREELLIARAGEVTTQFGQAIDHLGDERLNTRLGGIYTMRRIATANTDQMPTVVAILSAFLRHRADDLRGSEESERRAADVDAALQVLLQLEGRPPLDLRGTFLPDADLFFADLTGADLTGATLTGADLANLTGATLTGATLTGANLIDADLPDADLTGADLTGANLFFADLTGATLTGATLTGADLTGADLTGATLTGADLTGADLTGADLTSANLTGARRVPADADIPGWRCVDGLLRHDTDRVEDADADTDRVEDADAASA